MTELDAHGELDRRVAGRRVALIILRPTGAIYTAQTHGVACHHPEAEGQVFYFETKTHVPHVGCWGGFQPDEIVLLAAWLDAELPFLDLDFDSARLSSEFGEAWIPVTAGRYAAILVTENCD